MSKPITRRLFGKLAALSPAAAAQASQQAMADVGASVVGPAVYMGGPPAVGLSMGQHGAQMLALHKAGMLPDWAIRMAKRETSARARVLSPDLASMRSVSLSAKIRIQADRYHHADIANFETEMLDRMAQEKFMGWVR